jgi:hypothetical protein
MRRSRRRLLAWNGWQVKSIVNSLMNQIIDTPAGGRGGRPAATFEISENRVSASRCC